MKAFHAKRFVVVGYNDVKPANTNNYSIFGFLHYKGMMNGRRVYYVDKNDDGEYRIALLWGVITPLVGTKVIDTSPVKGHSQPITLLTHAGYSVVQVNKKEYLFGSASAWTPISKEVLMSFDILAPHGVLQDFRPPQLSKEDEKKYHQMWKINNS